MWDDLKWRISASFAPSTRMTAGSFSHRTNGLPHATVFVLECGVWFGPLAQLVEQLTLNQIIPKK
jgi:hypothetical protein